MPCNSEYMNPSNREVEISRVACLLDDLDGKAWSRSQWSGYHKDVYNRTRLVNADEMVSQLCSRLQTVDVSNYSLEMQIWWRDHTAADKARAEQDLAKAKTALEKQAALSKLTSHERKLLGL